MSFKLKEFEDAPLITFFKKTKYEKNEEKQKGWKLNHWYKLVGQPITNLLIVVIIENISYFLLEKILFYSYYFL